MAYVTEVSNLVHVPLGGLLGRKILFTTTTNMANTKQVLKMIITIVNPLISKEDTAKSVQVPTKIKISDFRKMTKFVRVVY